MKKTILIIISLLIVSNAAWAQNAPDGFCGIKWGTTKQGLTKILDSVPHLYLHGYETWISFSPKPGQIGWEKIGEVMVTDYVFRFSKSDKFYEASVSLPKDLPKCPNNFNILLKALTAKYGKPQSTTPLVLKINPKAQVGTQYTWTVENKVEINLWYNDTEEMGINGSLVYTYLPTLHEMEKAREKDVEKTKDKL